MEEDIKIIESKLLIKKIDKMLKDEEYKINLNNLKIRSDALGTHFTDMYIISLRDECNKNNGRREMLNLIRDKIGQIVEGDDK